jgi:5-oxoprolinase (ATP-hydrolysing) subunit A
MIVDVAQSIAQVKRMILEGRVRATSGKDIVVKADTLCVHGDQPQALQFVQRIRAALAAEGIKVAAPQAQGI